LGLALALVSPFLATLGCPRALGGWRFAGSFRNACSSILSATPSGKPISAVPFLRSSGSATTYRSVLRCRKEKKASNTAGRDPAPPAISMNRGSKREGGGELMLGRGG
jgi:hypothetical protein